MSATLTQQLQGVLASLRAPITQQDNEHTTQDKLFYLNQSYVNAVAVLEQLVQCCIDNQVPPTQLMLDTGSALLAEYQQYLQDVADAQQFITFKSLGARRQEGFAPFAEGAKAEFTIQVKEGERNQDYDTLSLQLIGSTDATSYGVRESWLDVLDDNPASTLRGVVEKDPSGLSTDPKIIATDVYTHSNKLDELLYGHDKKEDEALRYRYMYDTNELKLYWYDSDSERASEFPDPIYIPLGSKFTLVVENELIDWVYDTSDRGILEPNPMNCWAVVTTETIKNEAGDVLATHTWLPRRLPGVSSSLPTSSQAAFTLFPTRVGESYEDSPENSHVRMVKILEAPAVTELYAMRQRNHMWFGFQKEGYMGLTDYKEKLGNATTLHWIPDVATGRMKSGTAGLSMDLVTPPDPLPQPFWYWHESQSPLGRIRYLTSQGAMSAYKNEVVDESYNFEPSSGIQNNLLYLEGFDKAIIHLRSTKHHADSGKRFTIEASDKLEVKMHVDQAGNTETKTSLSVDEDGVTGQINLDGGYF